LSNGIRFCWENMGISRQTALTRIGTLSFRIQQHLEKMRSDPFSTAYNHWRGEAEQWCLQVERLARHCGRKSQMEVMNRVAQWKQSMAPPHE